MKRLIMTALLLSAVGTSVWAQTPAADDPHHPSQSAPSAAGDPKPPTATERQTQPSPMQGMAHDMMRRMEAMPAHDHDTCCGTKKSDAAK